MSNCDAWLDEHGRCDRDEGHSPDTPHALVNRATAGEWSKTIWPFPEDDADVKHYLAEAQAYEDEDNRKIADRAALNG